MENGVKLTSTWKTLNAYQMSSLLSWSSQGQSPVGEVDDKQYFRILACNTGNRVSIDQEGSIPARQKEAWEASCRTDRKPEE